MFSDAAYHAIVTRRVTVAGIGDQAQFRAADQEIRFSFQFDRLEAQPGGARPIQRGTCTLPDGQKLNLLCNDEKGTMSPDGTFRIFAGLRSDPFLLAWIVSGNLRPFQNLLEHDNVLCIVVDFDTQKVLQPEKGSLFGVIGETTPIPKASGFVGHPVPRFDWVGKPEQTNMRLNNPGLAGTEDVRDLWNQQTPFAISLEHMPIFRQRMMESLKNWDMRDDKADWSPAQLEASATVFLDDFMLIDVTKPTTDESFLEIEKSTLNGRPYETGGGRTINANDIDMLLTWMVNRDREALHGGAASATQPGSNTFPYFAPPNTQLQIVMQSVDLAASSEQVWAVIGSFGELSWHPLVAEVSLTGSGPLQLRSVETIDGKQIIERLTAQDESAYTYANVSGLAVSDYSATLSVKPKGSGSTVLWRAQYLPNGQPDLVVKTILNTLFKAGLESLKTRFGAAK
jgi:hypothetical protein